MQKKPSGEILDKYFKGNCTDDEIAGIDAWYESFSHGETTNSVSSNEELEEIKMAILTNVKNQIGATAFIDAKKRGNGWNYLISGIAAILIIAIFYGHFTQRPPMIKNDAAITVLNNTNTLKQILLSDGSKVWLSPKSKLVYPKYFEKNSRHVIMDGEGFFEVTKDKKRPFSIQSGPVTTKVWGTTFRVRAFKNDIAKIDVVTGKVSVSIDNSSNYKDQNNKEEVMLMPDQEVVYENGSLHLNNNTKSRDISMNIWRKVSLSFDNAPMSRVFAVLKKEFKVNIKSDNRDINADFLNADFTDESLPEIMEIMTKALNVTYSVNGSDFILSNNQ